MLSMLKRFFEPAPDLRPTHIFTHVHRQEMDREPCEDPNNWTVEAPPPNKPAPIFMRGYVRGLLIPCAVAVSVLSGCTMGKLTDPSASTENEIEVVHQTGLASERHKVSVRGEITHTRPKDKEDAKAAGWYNAGVAYFYAPEINTYPFIRMRELAVHEVCHAKLAPNFGHNTAHWCCMKNDGEIGYPPPETVMGQWPTCEGRR